MFFRLHHTVCPIHFVLHFMTLIIYYRSTNDNAPHYARFYVLVIFLKPKYSFSSTPRSDLLCMFCFHLVTDQVGKSLIPRVKPYYSLQQNGTLQHNFITSPFQSRFTKKHIVLWQSFTSLLYNSDSVFSCKIFKMSKNI
jgi:hypothetical protein